MSRYELVAGNSSKFWDIQLAGKTFTVKFGKIGANGQTQIKSFGSDAAAQKALDKLVAEKVKKGYRLVGARPAKATKGKAKAAPVEATGARDARNADLEKAIHADPGDREAFAIFADWLQEQGDPRGELIALQLGNKEKQAKALIDREVDYFLGPLAAHQTVYDEGHNNRRPRMRTTEQEKHWRKVHRQAFLWRNGYIHRVRISHNDNHNVSFDGTCAGLLDEVLRHPSGRFVAELAFNANGDAHDDDLQDIIDVLGKKAPPTVRKLAFGDNVDQISWHHTGNLGKLWKGVPNLRTLEIQSGHFEVGKMVAPSLERAVFITGGLSRSCGKGIATATMPKLKHLEIYYGDYGDDCSSIKEVRPLLARTDLPKLEYLGLKNARFTDDIARALAGAPVLKTLKTLDLSLGTLTDDGARALVAAKDALKHLECVDLSRSYLTKDGLKLVKNLCKKVITADQRKPDVYGDETYYYNTVSE